MKFYSRFLLMLSGAMLLALAGNAQTTLYNTLSDPVGTYYRVYNQGPLYNSFSTGSTAQLLTDVKVYMESGQSTFDSFTVGLYASSDNYPAALVKTIATVQDSSVSLSPGGILDIPVSPAIALTANTMYFIGMSSTASGSSWAATGSTSGTGVTGQYYCYEQNVETQANARSVTRPRGGVNELFCYSDAADPFLMSVTAGSATVAAAPDLSLTGMALLSMLLAACAVLFLRRSAPKAS